MAFLRATGTSFGTPLSKPMVLPFHITKSRGKSYATSSKTPPEFEWVTKIMSYSTTRTFNTTVLPSFTLVTSQKKITTLRFGTDSTQLIATYFVPASVPRTLSSHPMFPSIPKMYFVVHVKHSHMRNPAHSSRMSLISSLEAVIVDFPRLHSRCPTLNFPHLRTCLWAISKCQILGFPPHFHPCVRPQRQSCSSSCHPQRQ